VWLSLAEHFVRIEGVAGSNPVTSTGTFGPSLTRRAVGVSTCGGARGHRPAWPRDYTFQSARAVLLHRLPEERRITVEPATNVEAFLRAEHGRLLGVLTLTVGDRAVAEELAQEALIRAAQHWPRVSRMEQPSAWLMRVAMNLARSSLRRRSAERRAHARLGPPTDTDDGPDLADVLTVRDALTRLPDRQRAAVVLRRYGGLSAREAGDVMGVTDGTVRALCHQAMQALRTELGVTEGADHA
jgi:RNA polymerase sigma-70 factor (sigma-E family)